MKSGEIMQVGHVVKDLDAAIAVLSRDFGFGPWEIHIFDDKKVKNSVVHGKPSSHTYLCASCWSGAVQFEFMQPLTGRSIYDEYMEKHRGPGLQHFKIYCDDVKAAVADYEKKGYVVSQSGGIGDDLFYYLDSEDKTSGVTVELGNAGSVLPAPDRTYPAPAGKGQTGYERRELKDGDTMQLGHVVKDLDKAMETFYRDFGVGPFEVHVFDKTRAKNLMVHGKPSDMTFVVACAWSGGVQYELMQPLTGHSVYNEFLDAHGEGLQHIKIYYKDVEKEVENFKAKGYEVIQSGGIDEDLFYYLDSAKKIPGLTIELGNAGKVNAPNRWFPAKS